MRASFSCLTSLLLFISSTAFRFQNPTALIDLYNGAMKSSPLKTNIATAAIVSLISDSITQKIEREMAKKALNKSKLSVSPPPHSYYRSLTMFVYGGAVFGAFVTHWFRFLSKLFPLEGDMRTLAQLLKKVMFNQLFMSPGLNAFFFSFVIFTRNFECSFQTKFEMLKRKLRNDLPPTLMRSFAYWTIVNTFIFSSVPSHLNVLGTNIGFLIWTCYLSFIGFKKA